jgi:hypothetical protein
MSYKKCIAPLIVISSLSLLCGAIVSPTSQSTGQNAQEKQSKSVEPKTIQGCYELGPLEWKPDLELDKDEAVFITPPRRIELLAERGTQGKEKNGYLVRPAPGFPKSIHRASYWQPTGVKTIEVVFTTGTSGLSMELELEGDSLRGIARTHWDFRRKVQTAHINAHRIECGVPPQ